jgi:dihydroorotase
MTEFTIIKPDDWHLHLRDGAEMASVLPDTTRRFERAIVMPNVRKSIAKEFYRLFQRGHLSIL